MGFFSGFLGNEGLVAVPKFIVSKVNNRTRIEVSSFRSQHSTIPSFHTAHQENGHKKYRDSLRGVGSPRRGLYEPEANKL